MAEHNFASARMVPANRIDSPDRWGGLLGFETVVETPTSSLPPSNIDSDVFFGQASATGPMWNPHSNFAVSPEAQDAAPLPINYPVFANNSFVPTSIDLTQSIQDVIDINQLGPPFVGQALGTGLHSGLDTSAIFNYQTPPAFTLTPSTEHRTPQVFTPTYSTLTSQAATSAYSTKLGTKASNISQPGPSAFTDNPLTIFHQDGRTRNNQGRLDVTRPPRKPARDPPRNGGTISRANSPRPNRVISGSSAPMATVGYDKRGTRLQIGEQPKRHRRPSREACNYCKLQRCKCDGPVDGSEPCTEFAKYLVRRGWLYGWPAKLQNRHDYQIDEIFLHRPGATAPNVAPSLRRWYNRKIAALANRDQLQRTRITIGISQGVQGIQEPLKVELAYFDYEIHDQTSWSTINNDGTRNFESMPPLFVPNMAATKREMIAYLRHNLDSYIEGVLANQPEILELFQLAMAYRDAHPHKTLVARALEIWVAMQFPGDWWHITKGNEFAKIKPQYRPGDRFNGCAHLPVMVDRQLDYLLTKYIITPACEGFLEELSRIVDRRDKPDDWLDIFYATAIMMSNFDFTTKSTVNIMAYKGIKPGGRGGELTQGYIVAHKKMLSVFHHLFGGIGFVTETRNAKDQGLDKKQWEGLSEIQLEHCRALRHYVKYTLSRLPNWRQTSMYENNTYWLAQMAASGWRCDEPFVGPVDDYTNGDFLSSSM